jgi:hypothetical protein
MTRPTGRKHGRPARAERMEIVRDGRMATVIDGDGNVVERVPYEQITQLEKQFLTVLRKLEPIMKQRIIDRRMCGYTWNMLESLPWFPGRRSVTNELVNDPVFYRQWMAAGAVGADMMGEDHLGRLRAAAGEGLEMADVALLREEGVWVEKLIKRLNPKNWGPVMPAQQPLEKTALTHEPELSDESQAILDEMREMRNRMRALPAPREEAA